MNFKEGYIYHIYNRGNNKNRIFFTEDNYLFFLRKVRKELADYVIFLAYCLMPNHFHFLVRVKVKLSDELKTHSSDDLKSSDEYIGTGHRVYSSDDFKSSDEYRKSDEYSKLISKKIAILLRSYTRAINIQQNTTGSLFQQKTRSKCLNELDRNQTDYLKTCFFYIHQNPLKAGLVDQLEDWAYSSFPDYAGLRKGTLCEKSLAYEMININMESFIEQSYAAIEEKFLKRIWV
ncbi:MAG: transposase [Bacteroidales bacterium]|nr:transposase [Bacteroidales bacterium]